MTPVARAPRRYFIELMGAMALYFVFLWVHEYALRHTELAPAVRTTLALSPALPIVFVALAIFRFFQRVDEFHKRRMLEMMAVGAGITGVFAVCWGFAEDIGAPHLSLIWCWPVMAVSWVVIGAVRGIGDKLSEGKLLKALWFWTLTVWLAVGIALVYGYFARDLGWPHAWPVLLLVGTGVFVTRVGIQIFSKNGVC